MIKKSGLFIISAPSGAGKTTLVRGLLERIQPHHSIERVVTYTSRAMRPREIPGTDYHFISEADFQQKIEREFFIEWSNVYGAYYGSPRHELLKLEHGTSLIMILDVQGALNVIQEHATAVSIWVSPPDIEELHKRLMRRGSETDAQREARLMLAQKELSDQAALEKFQHQLVNVDYHETVDQLTEIVKQSLKLPRNYRFYSFTCKTKPRSYYWRGFVLHELSEVDCEICYNFMSFEFAFPWSCFNWAGCRNGAC
jgi:guanylate kinase